MACIVLACNGPEGGINPEPQPQPTPAPTPTPTPAPEEGVIPAHDFIMGSLLGFEKDIRNGKSGHSDGSSATTYYNKPLFDAYDFESDDSDWWDDIVEEYVYAGLDYIMPNCRGRLPKADTDPYYYVDHGDPTHIKDLIAALDRRGEEHLKIAIFDDAPASWAAARNMDLYRSYAPTHGDKAEDAYPIADIDAFYKYVWDYNIKLAFDNFYGENAANNKYLVRVGGKPLLVIWSPNGFVNVQYGGQFPDCNLHLKAVIDRLHKDFKDTYGEEVHICVDKAFADRDSYVTKQVIDSMNDWFNTVENSPYFSKSMHSMNNNNVGVSVPGFVVNDRSGNLMFVDSKHGKTLSNNLDYFVKYKATLVILEGFSDVLENAAYWRSTDTKYYDFPNQRLNILRRYSSTAPYPDKFRVEAEACDTYKDNSTGNSGKQYRKGDLDVARCIDGYKGWCVTDTEAGEWLKWVELPYSAGKSTIKIRYASKEAAKVSFDIDGRKGAEVSLPATGGDWSEVVAAGVEFEKNGWRETILNIISGSPEINCFTIVKE